MFSIQCYTLASQFDSKETLDLLPDLWQQETGRRSGPRSPVAFDVAYRLNQDLTEAPAMMRDLSARGICLYSDLPLPPRTEVEVVLYIPYEISLTEVLPVRLKAQVLRAESTPASHSAVAAVFVVPSDIAVSAPAEA
jgi:hypothetical protein